jgi:hypothetical protein
VAVGSSQHIEALPLCVVRQALGRNGENERHDDTLSDGD